jgi:hypothetical protein
MNIRAVEGKRFVRKTQLAPGEYRKNFHQIDREVIAAITSPEADSVTPLMSKIYLRLVNAPERFWERDGVLRIEAETKDEKLLKAWSVLCELVAVSSATASKALRWMHEQGIIGYFSGKNGVGLRIFLNRATSSIGVRQHRGGEKILAFTPASNSQAPASANEPAFNVPFGDLENSDTDNRSRAPKNGADARSVCKISFEQTGRSSPSRPPAALPDVDPSRTAPVVSLDEVVIRLRAELEPKLQAAADMAAAREHARTREWLESKGLPKAARVAQREAYDVLRRYGVIKGVSSHSRSRADVGRNTCVPSEQSQKLSDEEVNDLAEASLAMLEIQGRPVEVTLSEMGVEAGGFLRPEDAERVREKVCILLAGGGGRGNLKGEVGS